MSLRDCDSIEILPTGPVSGTVRPPGSKSITNRALVCAALAEGDSTLCGALDSEDTRIMADSLRQLGIPIAWDVESKTLEVQGCGGHFGHAEVKPLELYVGNSGTTVRFLTAMLTLGKGEFRLDGNERMRQRPIQDLLDALRQLGADAVNDRNTGCPPVRVRAAGLPGGTATVRGDVSSQFLSALLMAAPYARQPVRINIEGPLVSQPYIKLTLAVMADFGIRVAGDDLHQFSIPRGRYQSCRYDIEPDASAASYFFGAAAVTGGRVTVSGLSRQSLQGDMSFVNVLKEMGCRLDWAEDGVTVTGGPLQGVDVNMNAMSDTVQTLAVVSLFATGPTTISGVAHIRHKETDRIAALAAELRKLGAQVDERPDGLRIVPQNLHGAAIDTYDDHRMAMSFALAGLRVPSVVIKDPGCTAKTYPGFFADLAKLGS